MKKNQVTLLTLRLIGLVGLTSLIVIVPHYSSLALFYSTGLFLIMLWLAIRVTIRPVWGERLALASFTCFLFFSLGARYWLHYSSYGLLVVGTFFAFFIAAFVLPYINNVLAKQLLTSQFSPQTETGKRVQKLALALIPSGYWLGRAIADGSETVALFIGTAAIFVSLLFMQTAAYQLWIARIEAAK